MDSLLVSGSHGACPRPADRSGKDELLLRDPTEALPIAVITRFIEWFHEFGIPVGGVIVNMLIDSRSSMPLR